MFEPLLRFTNTNCTGHTHTPTNKQTLFAWKTSVRPCKGNNKKSCCFWTLCLSQLMRSSAVGIDKQKNGFVNLGDFPVCLNFFKPCIGWEPPPAMLWAASVLRGRRASWAHTTHAFTTAFCWKMAQTLGVYAYMLQVCYCFSAQSTNVSI